MAAENAGILCVQAENQTDAEHVKAFQFLVAGGAVVLLQQMTQDYLDGRHKAAAKKQLAMLPLIHAVFAEVNPIPVKAALHIMGKIQKEYRLPLCEPSNETLYLLFDEMKRYGIPVK